jgi:allantoinase
MIEHRHKVTPHEGRMFTGQVQQTFVRGIKVYDQGNFSKEHRKLAVDEIKKAIEFVE